jgi:hypothetical protein
VTTWEAQVKARIATVIKEARESKKNNRTDDLAEDVFEALMGEDMLATGPGEVVRYEFDVPGALARDEIVADGVRMEFSANGTPMAIEIEA